MAAAVRNRDARGEGTKTARIAPPRASSVEGEAEKGPGSGRANAGRRRPPVAVSGAARGSMGRRGDSAREQQGKLSPYWVSGRMR